SRDLTEQQIELLRADALERVDDLADRRLDLAQRGVRILGKGRLVRRRRLLRSAHLPWQRLRRLAGAVRLLIEHAAEPPARQVIPLERAGLAADVIAHET